MSMYNVLMIGAAISEIEAPIYIGLQIVRRADGLGCFQAMAPSSFCCSSCFFFSLASGEHASMTLTSRLLKAR